MIFDDECDMGEHLDHLILCDTSRGFGEWDFMKAKEKHYALMRSKRRIDSRSKNAM